MRSFRLSHGLNTELTANYTCFNAFLYPKKEESSYKFKARRKRKAKTGLLKG